MPFSIAQDWHAGEEKMHKLMRVPNHDNPTSGMLTPQAAAMLQRAPLLALGTLDEQGRPWTTVWGGPAGFSQPLGGSMIGVKTMIESKYDPVINALFGEKKDGELIKPEGEGQMIGGLTIDLETRKRVKIYGRMFAGAILPIEDDEHKNGHAQSQIQLVVRVDQSLGNCPKYLNKKYITPAPTQAVLALDSPDLNDDAVDMIARSDLFFVSSAHGDLDMDTNHRGGPVGFVRTHKREDGRWELIWPEYSGNRLYQTLGNLQETPRAGLVFLDFDRGDVLYITGETEVLILQDAAKVITHSNLAVRVIITGARLVQQGLPFRGSLGERSPYNPKVRPLAIEAKILVDSDITSQDTATLLERIPITPSISRFRFKMNKRQTWKAGQWAALDFSEELDIGYSHMRDDDPLSINDDFVRTFTVSSPPAPRNKLSEDEFEITIRRVGAVTNWLFNHRNVQKLDVPIRGFGGDTFIDQPGDAIVPFVAGGIGITPLLAQLPSLDISRLRIFWTLNINDIELAADFAKTYPDSVKVISLYVTGVTGTPSKKTQATLDELKNSGATYEMRRIEKDDLISAKVGDRWHMCVSMSLRKILLDWLQGKVVVFEDFNF